MSAFLKQQMSNGRIVSVTDLDSLGGHYGVRFNALRCRALWGFNDRSHGTNPEYWLGEPEEAIVMFINAHSLWHAFCTFIQHVRGRYKVELLNKNEGQHENMDATWTKWATFDRIVDNLSKMEATCLKVNQNLYNYMGLKYLCTQGCHTDDVSKNQEITGALNVCFDLWPFDCRCIISCRPWKITIN